MRLPLLKLVALATAAAASAGLESKLPRRVKEVKNVAIIGAGAAGTSAAYYLRKFAEEEGLAVNITVFEKTDHIGGRTITVNAFNDPRQRVELGASIFIKDNHIMYNATKNFNLSPTGLTEPQPTDYTAIWDGETILFKSEAGASKWWDAARLFLKYGLVPYRAVRLVKSSVGTFLRLYDAPYFPFRSLTQRAFELGLLRLTGVTAVANSPVLIRSVPKINPDFVRDLMQSATRVNYASNMAYIHGLEAMSTRLLIQQVSFSTDGAVAIAGGNWQIFEKLLQHSGAAYYPNTSVAALAFQKGTDKPGSAPKYLVSTKSSTSRSKAMMLPTAFDNVILASPWQFSDIEAAHGVIKHRIDTIPYMKLHVTLFTSPFLLQPSFFGLKAGTKAPSNVYTTLGKDEEAHEGPKGVGRTGFYSISTLRTVTNPRTQGKEFLYKIFSAEPVNSTFLSDILGTPVPPTFISNETTSEVEPISWYYPHWFYSYPIESPRVTFQDPIVGRGLYYTSGVESFISTMETSALMGMNVARLMADDFAGVTRSRRGDRFAGAGDTRPRAPREDFWDSMDSEMGASMNFLGADEL
ncbi:Prenylcysteine oxidase [Metarhizium album ARSEF 1941]|uniref:Prenylcysteine oxidase n=1 Tax=Metarhizium album (strain ARSEF 1941) TaxID=1081103 RepID=A0A0B2WT18_METAS|nr:Prenylcysteine oxidase [Metarhizium album ARSEF 1941]KHN97183.1 Prenylcysteine oxidase [Metarhizium album ARSEF 1941]